jgi:hypothetical protein
VIVQRLATCSGLLPRSCFGNHNPALDVRRAQPQLKLSTWKNRSFRNKSQLNLEAARLAGRVLSRMEARLSEPEGVVFCGEVVNTGTCCSAPLAARFPLVAFLGFRMRAQPQVVNAARNGPENPKLHLLHCIVRG